MIALLFPLASAWIGLMMAFGAGVLISAVAFDLVEEAAGVTDHNTSLCWGSSPAAGSSSPATGSSTAPAGATARTPPGPDGSALAIVLGTVLDGIPESMVIGLTISEGGEVGAAYLTAVFISNLPESISSTGGLIAGGWKRARIIWLWLAITLVSGLSSLAGYALFQESSPNVVAFVLAFAAGAILTMLADTMMPEAFEYGGKLVGVVTTLGFAIAFTIHTLD